LLALACLAFRSAPLSQGGELAFFPDVSVGLASCAASLARYSMNDPVAPASCGSNRLPKEARTSIGTDRDRIFVQIASYRDPECQWTLEDMFEKAANPDRIFAGVVWQFVPREDDHCFELSFPPEQVRTAYVGRAPKPRNCGEAKSLPCR
jgi:hypothetical protein